MRKFFVNSVVVMLMSVHLSAIAATDSQTFTMFAAFHANDKIDSDQLAELLGLDVLSADFEAVSSFLKRTQTGVRTDMHSMLRENGACEDSSWTKEPHSLANRLDAENDKIFKRHYKQASLELSDVQLSAVQSLVTMFAGSTYVKFSDLENANEQVQQMCNHDHN